jgi:hypothetical protein
MSLAQLHGKAGGGLKIIRLNARSFAAKISVSA